MYEQLIYSAFEKIVATKIADKETHFVYAGDLDCGLSGFYDNGPVNQFCEIILRGMKKYEINSRVMFTKVRMVRYGLIKKDKMEQFCKGFSLEFRESINDDLQSLFEDIQFGQKIKNKNNTYFLPRLTVEHLDLAQKRDPKYLNNFFTYMLDYRVNLRYKATRHSAERKKALRNRASLDQVEFEERHCYRKTYVLYPTPKNDRYSLQ